MHAFLSASILHPLDTLSRAKSLQHICPQLLKGPWVSFCPLELLWHWCVGKTCFRTHPNCSLRMEKLKKMLCLRPGSLSSVMPHSQKGMENPAAGNQSASYQHSLECEQDKQVQTSPLVHDVWHYALNLNISDFICQLILAHSLPLPQCHRRYGAMLFHT